MPRQRPPAVLVIAILNFVGGGIGLLSGLWTLVVLLAGGAAMFTPPTTAPPPNAQRKDVQELQEFNNKFMKLSQDPPGGKAVQYSQVMMDLALSVLMIVSGIGLVRMDPWGRSVAILYAVLSILNHLYQAVYMFGFMIPAFQAILNEAPKGNQFLGMFTTMMGIVLYASAVIGFLFIIYPIVVLIIMYRPAVVAAFRGETAAPEPEGSWERPYPKPAGEDPDPGEPDDHIRPGGRWSD